MIDPISQRRRRRARRALARADAQLRRGLGRAPAPALERLRGARQRLEAELHAPAPSPAHLDAAERAVDTAAAAVAKAARSPFPLALSLLVGLTVAVGLRLFVFEVFRIPSSSMRPTLVVGDHIVLNQLSYGLPLPFTTQWLTRWAEPRRGEVVVFRYPKDPSRDFVKRVVALPGDRIRVRGCEVWVNDHRLRHGPQRRARYRAEDEGVSPQTRYVERQGWTERLPEEGSSHTIYCPLRQPASSPSAAGPLPGLRCQGRRGCLVEPGYLFVMGDNRFDSSDSRSWGAVPIELVRGRARWVWWSWGPKSGPHWGRFGQAIQ